MQFRTSQVPVGLSTGGNPLDLFRVADVVNNVLDQSPALLVEMLTMSGPKWSERFVAVLGFRSGGQVFGVDQVVEQSGELDYEQVRTRSGLCEGLRDCERELADAVDVKKVV